MERTLIIVKHDGVARGLIGQIIKRFERVGLKLVGFEFIKSTQDMGQCHYPNSKKWLEKAGTRTLNDYAEKGIDPIQEFGTSDPVKIGKVIKQWNVDYLSIGPILLMVWEGPGAVAIGRKLVGDTIPLSAIAGTIRGDFGIDNPELANKQKRPIYNIVHASGDVEEAKEEIALWFSKEELFDYKTYSSDFQGIYCKM